MQMQHICRLILLVEMQTKCYENDDFFRLVEIEIEEVGSVRIKVKGFSMQPIIRNGRDTVLLEKPNGREFSKGDICLFRYRGKHILHRYVADENDFMVMQGDNLFSFEYCKKEDVVGIVTSINHNGKDISPNSSKWHFITELHRFYMRFRMFVGRTLRFLGLRK